MSHLVSHFIEQQLNEKYQNKWCLVFCKQIKKTSQHFPHLLSIHHKDSQEWEETQCLQQYSFLPQWWRGNIIYIPQHSDKIRINSLQNDPLIPTLISLKIFPLSRLLAAGFLLLSNPKSIIRTILGSPIHLKKRLRTALNYQYNQSKVHLSYTDWCDLYDRWGQQEKKTLYQSPFYNQWPAIHITVYDLPDNHNPETDISLNNQWSTPNKADQSYIAILQNGEVLSTHALAIFADQAARYDFPAALYADSDMLNYHHQRTSPHFKPNAGYLTIASGLLTQDIWLFRRDVFDSYQQQYPTNHHSAYTHRLALALHVWKQQLPIHHIPFILSHRHIGPSTQAITEMRQIVVDDLSTRQWQNHIKTGNFPLKIQLSSSQYPVSLVIPTTISSKTIQYSILSVLSNTDYPNFELILVISQSTSLTSKQRFYLRPLLQYKNLQIVWLKTKQFNFSQSCNFGILHAKHDFFAIVNDDVRPKTPQWLRHMMGHMQDPNVGAVGAKLYYPNGQIQHAGIIMGAANLCEHAGRFQQSSQFTFTYDHDVSAVTGACMLIRRTAYERVEGLDENYEIAYNDIDFCLKLRQANFHIIQCQHAELIHYESLSLGNHYTGQRAGKERQEILSIRSKWRATYNSDPFYNPNLSLQRGMDGRPAFPPRITCPFATSTFQDK